MPFGRVALLLAGVVLVMAGPAQAQQPQPLSATRPLQFESWRATSPAEAGSNLTVARLDLGSRSRTRNALLGGAIGAAAGLVVCTAFSSLINDSAEGGLSFCPLDSNLLFGGGGFVLGAAIGWAI